MARSSTARRSSSISSRITTRSTSGGSGSPTRPTTMRRSIPFLPTSFATICAGSRRRSNPRGRCHKSPFRQRAPAVSSSVNAARRCSPMSSAKLLHRRPRPRRRQTAGASSARPGREDESTRAHLAWFAFAIAFGGFGRRDRAVAWAGAQRAPGHRARVGCRCSRSCHAAPTDPPRALGARTVRRQYWTHGSVSRRRTVGRAGWRPSGRGAQDGAWLSAHSARGFQSAADQRRAGGAGGFTAASRRHFRGCGRALGTIRRLLTLAQGAAARHLDFRVTAGRHRGLRTAMGQRT